MAKALRFFVNAVDKVSVSSTATPFFPFGKYLQVKIALEEQCKRNGVYVDIQAAPLATFDELIVGHCPQYVKEAIDGTLSPKAIRKIGFGWSESVCNRSRGSAGATLAATHEVCSTNKLRDGKPMFSAHIGGGTHHAHYSYGEGFCFFNDLYLASRMALQQYSESVKSVLIIDLDVHQGNGTATMASREGCPDKLPIYTFSMHCKENYFSKAEHSYVDVEVPKGTEDKQYLELLSTWLVWLLDTAQPDLVFYQGGVDVHKDDKLGKLRLTDEGVSARNRLVYQEIVNYDQKKFVNKGEKYAPTKVVITMGGGYPKVNDPSHPSFRKVVDLHTQVYLDAIEVFS